MEFGITQPAGKAVKGQRFIIMVFYALADLVNNDLYLFLPFVHPCFNLVSATLDIL